MEKIIQLVILEDHPMTLEGYRAKLIPAEDIIIACTLSYGDELELALSETPADVLLMDLQVPTNATNPNPFPIWHTLARIVELYPNLVILVISMFNSPALIDTALKAGINGYILKDDYTAYHDLPAVIRMVANGSAYFSPLVRKRWIEMRNISEEPFLSSRQLEALSLCATYPNDSLGIIAIKMHVAQSTVRNLLSRAYLKLEVNNRWAAVERSRQLGLLLTDNNNSDIL